MPMYESNDDEIVLSSFSVLPPSSRYFSMTLLSYPSETGMIAPGLNAEMRIRFAPDSLADYDDFLVVQTETDSFPLPLLARRSPPNLTLPAQLCTRHECSARCSGPSAG